MIQGIRTYFFRQIEEIRNDTALRIYGACIMLGQVLSFFHWQSGRMEKFLQKSAEAICWPFFENCFEYRFLDFNQVHTVFLVFGAVSIIGLALFLLPHRYLTAAYFWMMSVNFFKILIVIQDFQLRRNQHYMLFFITVAFLFLPNKRNLLRYLLVFFYFWAGTIKFNYEWISGAAMTVDPLWISRPYVPAACVYALILELLIVWGLLSQKKWLYWGAFFQLCLFHLVSWPVVMAFYPLLMYGLLSIFPLTYFIKNNEDPPSLMASLARFKQPLSTYLFLGFFSFLQLVPVIIPGNERITGEGRLFSLHMIDAMVVCKGEMTLKFYDGSAKVFEIPDKNKDVNRIKCDPVVNFSRAKQQCRNYLDDPNFNDLDLYYEARLSSEEVMRPLVDIKDFCGQELSYDLWKPNDWIKKH